MITVCDQANESCPVVVGAWEPPHRNVPDPSPAMGTEENQRVVSRDARDAMRARNERELVEGGAG